MYLLFNEWIQMQTHESWKTLTSSEDGKVTWKWVINKTPAGWSADPGWTPVPAWKHNSHSSHNALCLPWCTIASCGSARLLKDAASLLSVRWSSGRSPSELLSVYDYENLSAHTALLNKWAVFDDTHFTLSVIKHAEKPHSRYIYVQYVCHRAEEVRVCVCVCGLLIIMRLGSCAAY